MTDLSRPLDTAPVLPFRQSIDRTLQAAIGAHGLTPAEYERWIFRLRPALQQLQRDYDDNSLPLLHTPSETADIAAAEAAMSRPMPG